MSAYAIYRLPHADHVTLIQQTEGEPSEYQSCSELNGKRGFVVAPFQVTAQQPILLIRPDIIETIESGRQVSDLVEDRNHVTCPPDSSYAIDFANYHAQLETGLFRKIVLARCVDEESEEPIVPMELFHRACMLYPRMFISLVSTTKSGV